MLSSFKPLIFSIPFSCIFSRAPLVSSVPGILESVSQLHDNTLPQKGLSMDSSNISTVAQVSVVDEFPGLQKRIRKILPKGPLPQDVPTPASAIAYRKTDVNAFQLIISNTDPNFYQNVFFI